MTTEPGHMTAGLRPDDGPNGHRPGSGRRAKAGVARRRRPRGVPWAMAETPEGPAPEWALDAFGTSLALRSPATGRAYRADLAAFCTWAERGGCPGPAAVTRVLLRRYLAYLGTR